MSKQRPCNSCPFRKDTDNFGSPDWLMEVVAKSRIHKGFNHSCHKTDPKADGYVGHKDGRDSICMGAVALMAKDRGLITDPRVSVLMAKGELTEEDLPMEEVFDSMKEFILHQLRGMGCPEEALAPIVAEGHKL